MPEKLIEIRSGFRGKIYTITSIARIARVTVEFVDECECENLIQPTIVPLTHGFG